jgi:TM2 domain-containing membrane protein YozV
MKRYLIVVIFTIFMLQQLCAQFKPALAIIGKNSQSQTLPPSLTDIAPSAKEKKSVFFAVIASLILPGAGEFYAGSFESGKYFLIAESGLWLTYAGFRAHSNWLRQDAQAFAQQHAGANFNDKNDQYSVNIGNFNTTADYNSAKSRNREYDLIYLTDVSKDYLWNWDSDANRLRFKDLRIHSDEVKNNAKFLIGVVVVNHIISAFSAARKTAAYNRSISMIDNLQIYTYALNAGSGIEGIGLSISTKF